MRKILGGLLLILVLSGCASASKNSDSNNIDEVHFKVMNGSIYQFEDINKKSLDQEIISKVQDMISELELTDKNKVKDYDGLVGANTYALDLSENDKIITSYTFYGNFVTVKTDDAESIYELDNMKDAENLINFLQKI
ncbi:hypothetical protein [Enterococcus casseliflavus]|jgi:hypothetical protein|uniref:hypothetical protein n=1 Tax=Enterococcus TaxID=1350 RepID=UPI000890ADD6|nr:hypothetical protein [Enterococcus casseliflavus]AYJ45891.1 hypothetical protein D8N35_12695 [Enterococcus casseliflavus]MDB1690130.1 hypothetical protein [Enterococcus casseliflavus]MEB6213090.1 hypothetical protein [Enterococcus casseliflavus]WEL45942.1 hypothetical protein P0G38_09160 [Enterococcus casseliflavus]SDL06542.1 hypothetical protein SAMN05216513_12249 [Enterococcus casseliflavus]